MVNYSALILAIKQSDWNLKFSLISVASPPPKESSKKRNHDDMLDQDLFDDLMNKTFSDTDHTDSTFTISKFTDISTNGSLNDAQSFSEDYGSPLKDQYSSDSSLQETLPNPVSKCEHQEPNISSKSNEVTFVSTVDDTEESAFALTEDDSSHSLNGMHSESNGSAATESTVHTNGSSKIGKESLNVPVDPVDAMMFKFVEMKNNGKINIKKAGKNKRRNFSLTSQENLNQRQNNEKASKSQEALDQL